MVYLRLVQLIEDNARELTNRLCSELLSREETKGYRSLPEDLVCERIDDVYRRLSVWLNPDKQTRGEIRKVYTELGRKRCHEGIPLHEVILAFMLAKRNLWVFAQEMKFFDTMDELYQAVELNNKVVYFFDGVIYHVAVGYEDEVRKSKSEKPASLAG